MKTPGRYGQTSRQISRWPSLWKRRERQSTIRVLRISRLVKALSIVAILVHGRSTVRPIQGLKPIFPIPGLLCYRRGELTCLRLSVHFRGIARIYTSACACSWHSFSTLQTHCFCSKISSQKVRHFFLHQHRPHQVRRTMDRIDTEIERAETQASDQFSRRLSGEQSSADTATIDKEISQHPTHVNRWETQVIQHVHTVGAAEASRTTSRASRIPLPNFGGGKPYPPVIPAEREAYVVDFDGPLDSLHPMNWSFGTK